MFDRKEVLADRIRIGHVIGWLHFGGKENGIVNLVNSLDSDVFENYIFSFVERGPLADRVNPERCRVIELGGRLGGDCQLYFKLARAFRQHKIHIAHTHSWATLLEGIVGAKVARVPVIVHGEHGTIKDNTKIHVYIQRFLWNIADQILSVSETLRDDLHAAVGFPKERIRVISNGVDMSRFRIAHDGTAYKAKLGFPSGSVVFGAIGRLVPVKCLPTLLEASTLVFDKVPHSYLVIVGDGPLRDELKAIVRRRNIAERVKFLGWRPDVPNILKALDVFVCSSESEGMSNTILEAMASGIPVVATAVGGNAELVVHGETGLLVAWNDPNILASAVVKLLANQGVRRKMGEIGRQRVEECFSLDTMTRNYAKFYVEMFSHRLQLSQRLQSKMYEKSLAV
jgi:sugar transferase (PEP-CTERM/EpsH1 system associated)